MANILNKLLANSGDDIARSVAKTASNKLDDISLTGAIKTLDNDAYSFDNYIKRNIAGINDKDEYYTVKKILEDAGAPYETLDNLLNHNVRKTNGSNEFKSAELYVNQAKDNVKHDRIKREVDIVAARNRDKEMQDLIKARDEENYKKYLESPEFVRDTEYKAFDKNRQDTTNIFGGIGKTDYFKLKESIKDPDIIKFITTRDLDTAGKDNIQGLIDAATRNRSKSDAIQRDVDIANGLRNEILEGFKNANPDTKWKQIKHSVSKSRYYDTANEMPSEYFYEVPESVYDKASQLRALRNQYQGFSDADPYFGFPFEKTATPYRVTRYSQHAQGGWNNGVDTKYENVPEELLEMMSRQNKTM